MPTHQSKIILILRSSVADTAAAPGLLKLTRGDDVSKFDDSDTGGLGVHVQGLAGADDIVGSEFADVLVATSARFSIADTADPAAKSAAIVIRLDAATPDDTLIGDGGDDLLIGASGDDSLAGDSCQYGTRDVLCVGGADYLLGFGGDDGLQGDDGDDSLDGGTGNNHLDGGEGIDTATWAWISKGDLPKGAPGVVLNLSGETLVVGNDTPDGRVTVFDLAGGVVGKGARMLNNKNPELMRIDDGEAGKLEQDATGALFDTYDTLVGIERFDGGGGKGDIAILDESFVEGDVDGDGYVAFSDGIVTIWLRGYEHVLLS